MPVCTAELSRKQIPEGGPTVCDLVLATDEKYSEQRSIDPYFPFVFTRQVTGRTNPQDEPVVSVIVRRKTARQIVRHLIYIAFHRDGYDDIPVYDGWGPQTDNEAGKEPQRVIITREGGDELVETFDGDVPMADRFRIECEAVEVESVEAMREEIMLELSRSRRLHKVVEEAADDDDLYGIREGRHFSVTTVEISRR